MNRSTLIRTTVNSKEDYFKDPILGRYIMAILKGRLSEEEIDTLSKVISVGKDDGVCSATSKWYDDDAIDENVSSLNIYIHFQYLTSKMVEITLIADNNFSVSRIKLSTWIIICDLFKQKIEEEKRRIISVKQKIAEAKNRIPEIRRLEEQLNSHIDFSIDADE